MGRLSRNSRATAGYLAVAPAESTLAAGSTHARGRACNRRDELVSCRCGASVGYQVTCASRCTGEGLSRAFGFDHRAERSRHNRDRRSGAPIDCREGSVDSSPRPRARACTERKQHPVRVGLKYRQVSHEVWVHFGPHFAVRCPPPRACRDHLSGHQSFIATPSSKRKLTCDF